MQHVAGYWDRALVLFASMFFFYVTEIQNFVENPVEMTRNLDMNV